MAAPQAACGAQGHASSGCLLSRAGQQCGAAELESGEDEDAPLRVRLRVALAELIDQRRRHGRRCRGDHDPVEGSAIGRAVEPVAEPTPEVPRYAAETFFETLSLRGDSLSADGKHLLLSSNAR